MFYKWESRKDIEMKYNVEFVGYKVARKVLEVEADSEEEATRKAWEHLNCKFHKSFHNYKFDQNWKIDDSSQIVEIEQVSTKPV